MGHDVSVREFGTDAADLETVGAWYLAHGGEVFPAPVLPPHGCIASVDGKPAAALWVYLSYGIGVAHVEWPVSRPGAGIGVLGLAFRAAMDWIESVCRAHDCHLIFANTLPRIAKYLPRLGFSGTGQRVQLYKVLT